MTDYLTLCQNVARESGIVSGVNPTTVVGQSGDLLKIVNWVAKSWEEIQNDSEAWLWMRKEFSDSLTQGTKKYSLASLNITDGAAFVEEVDAYTVYDPAIGVADEGELIYMTYNEWKKAYDRGAQTQDRPSRFSFHPDGSFLVGPIPDKTYTIRGIYRQETVVLSANADVPDMPVRFHDVIEYRALQFLNEHEEASVGYAGASANYSKLYAALQRDQLPDVDFGPEPLA